MSFLAKNIRFLRKQRNEKQEDIAKLFNKKANTVGNWENRKSEPSVGEIVLLADHFGVGLNELLNVDLTHRSANDSIEPGRTQNQAADTVLPEYYVSPDSHRLPSSNKTYYPGPELTLAESHDSFWVLIRELRAINEKLDELKAAIGSAHLKTDSDKSHH